MLLAIVVTGTRLCYPYRVRGFRYFALSGLCRIPSSAHKRLDDQ